jgi:hypothetical protein
LRSGQQKMRGSCNLEDTALGRKKALMQLQFQAAGVDMPADEFNRIIKLRKRKYEDNNAD